MLRVGEGRGEDGVVAHRRDWRGLELSRDTGETEEARQASHWQGERLVQLPIVSSETCIGKQTFNNNHRNLYNNQYFEELFIIL